MLCVVVTFPFGQLAPFASYAVFGAAYSAARLQIVSLVAHVVRQLSDTVHSRFPDFRKPYPIDWWPGNKNTIDFKYFLKII